MGGQLRKVFKVEGVDARDILRKFWTNVTGLDLCRRMWCGKCYTLESSTDFHVADPENLSTEDGDEDYLLSGWKVKESDRK